MAPSSSWPFDYLNTLSPDASPSNPLVTAASAQDLSLPVDSSELARQLEAWTNITIDFGEDNNPSASPTGFGNDDDMASHSHGLGAEAQRVGSNSFNELLGTADPGDLNPYNPRCGVGTHHESHHNPPPFFAHENAFRIPHELQQPIAPQHLTTSGPTTTGASVTAQDFTSAGPLSFSALLAANEGLSTLLANQPDPFAGLPLLGPYPALHESPLSDPLAVSAAPPPSSISAPSISPDGSSSTATSAGPPAKRTAPNRRASGKASSAGSGSGASASGSPAEPTGSAGADGAADKKRAVSGSAPVDDEDAANRHAIDDDKRRRNTAASARFRVKKKLREQAMERTANGLRERVSELEKEVDGLKKENGWLRGLIVDKAAREVGSVPPSLAEIAGGTKRPREGED